MREASSVIWAFTEAISALRSSGGMARPVSSLRARSSTLVRREVRGVRSSWPASAMSWAWRSRDVARDAVIELNERDSRAISSSPSTGMRTVRSSVRATCSTASVSSSTGRRPERATQSPAAPAPMTPMPETRRRTQARVERGLSTSLAGRATETARSVGAVPGWVAFTGYVKTRIFTPSLSTAECSTLRASWLTTARSVGLTGISAESGLMQMPPWASMSWTVRPESLRGGSEVARWQYAYSLFR